ncbi:hypothetical protein [Aeromonas sobria]|uniref:hypothetical protein n=1 Tax=Aeromonas sobria TaxID=646 RepID=UPI0011DFDC0E|nr:hypothetical protein [Aeromonas sobria]
MSDKELVWSSTEEFGWGDQCDSPQELIEQHGYLAGDIVHVGDKNPYTGVGLMNAETICDQIIERAYDDLGECAESWSYSEEATKELDDYIKQWLEKHNPTGFFLIENTRKHVLTEQDIQEAQHEAE